MGLLSPTKEPPCHPDATSYLDLLMFELVIMFLVLVYRYSLILPKPGRRVLVLDAWTNQRFFLDPLDAPLVKRPHWFVLDEVAPGLTADDHMRWGATPPAPPSEAPPVPKWEVKNEELPRGEE